MSHEVTSWSSSTTALEARDHLLQLEAERAAALGEGLGEVAAYMDDLHTEIDHRRAAYIALAVTEIATLRAELFGPQVG